MTDSLIHLKGNKQKSKLEQGSFDPLEGQPLQSKQLQKEGGALSSISLTIARAPPIRNSLHANPSFVLYCTCFVELH